MSITKKQVLDYVTETPYNTNRQVLDGLVTELMDSDNLDTSDATATAGDILASKTAYVNGKKVIGTITDISNQKIISEYIEADNASSELKITLTAGGSVAVKIGQNLVAACPYENLAANIGLTAEKIKSGETILGVTGTYTGETS